MRVIEYSDTPDAMMIVEVVDGHYRMIVLEKDEDTGARSCKDIVECRPFELGSFLRDYCCLYEIDVQEEIRLPIDVNVGKATSVNGITRKIQEAMNAAYVQTV